MSLPRVLRTVHVFSNIKNLINELQSVCPNIQFCEIGSHEPKERVLNQLQKAEVLISDPDCIFSYMHDMPSLKWVQLTWAGAESLMKNIDLNKPPSYTITRFGGYFGEDMADYILGHIIAWEKKFKFMGENQKKHEWFKPSYRRLSTLTMGILGLGDIGKDVAKMAKAHGMKVWGMGRTSRNETPDFVDQYQIFSGLQKLLSSSDFICNILPSTPATKHMLSGDVFKCCAQSKPVFINIGRGDIIDEASLVNALKEGWISGAILDVFEEEPLPKESKLWDMSEVVITPHMAALSFPDQVAEGFAKNLKLYEAGQSLRYVIDVSQGY